MLEILAVYGSSHEDGKAIESNIAWILWSFLRTLAFVALMSSSWGIRRKKGDGKRGG